MPDTDYANDGSMETPADAGKGPPGVVNRWVTELDLADKQEADWRKRARDVEARYRDEKTDSTQPGRYSGVRFNILYSNIQTICPTLYNQSPSPDVRRRYRDADPVGKEVSEVLERCLSFTMDECDFDRYMRLAVKDQQLCGRGVTRVRYNPAFAEEDDEMSGDSYESLQGEEVKFEHVGWADFRHGPGQTWEQVEWVAFRHLMTRDELKSKFGDKMGEDVTLDYSPMGLDEGDSVPVTDTFKRATVWEVWCNRQKEVIYISKTLKERPLKTEQDPLKLKNFFPTPRPLYAMESTDSLVPVEPFRFYRDQADELDNITMRISGIIAACKVRGIYDSTITEMVNIMDASENMMIPAQDVLPLMQSGGLENAIWMWPIEKIAGILGQLYQQREQIKTTIYEITGIADIMRGSSAAMETLGAQQLKVQFGTMRMDDSRRDIQRYARDLIRIAAEIISEQFTPESLQLMTDIKLPSMQEKQQAQMTISQNQQMAMQGPPMGEPGQQMEMQGPQQGPPPEIPPEVLEMLKKPTWEECIQLLRDDKQRSFRVDIETDSTISGNYAADQQAITQLLQGVSAFIADAGPAVASGYLPLEAAKAMIMAAVRRFKLGREVEDALDMIGENDPTKAQAQDSGAGVEQALQMKMQIEQQEAQTRAQEVQQKMQIDQARMNLESQIKQADLAMQEKELALREREIAIKEFEAQKPEPDSTHKIQADMMMAREKMQFEAMEADKQRQVELAKAIMAEFNDGENRLDGPEQALTRAAEIMDRIKSVISATNLPLAETTMLVAGEPRIDEATIIVDDQGPMLQ
jgi:hypothetical protein